MVRQALVTMLIKLGQPALEPVKPLLNAPRMGKRGSTPIEIPSRPFRTKPRQIP